jgi:serine/threonine protein kinase
VNVASGVRYTIVSLVGEGGFGKVYRARLRSAEAFEKDVAVKILTDDHPPRALLQRFRDEARILGRLRDRAIVGAQNPVRLGGHWSVVMDYVDGESLGGLVTRGPIPPGVALEVVGEVARALDNAWGQQGPDGQALELIHRDIKPDNVQLTPGGEVKLLDFGIAKATFADREAKTKQAFAGTPGYIAPERTQGIELPVGDVYSLGVLLHEVVQGTRPKMPATVFLDGDLPRVSREDLEVDDPDALDPHVREVLELAAWMRAYEHQERPSARQVEDLCRALRQKIPGDWLRDWAERHVMVRNDLPPDERVGQTFVEEEEGGPTQVPREAATPAPAIRLEPGSGVPLRVGRRRRGARGVRPGGRRRRRHLGPRRRRAGVGLDPRARDPRGHRRPARPGRRPGNPGAGRPRPDPRRRPSRGLHRAWGPCRAARRRRPRRRARASG